MAKRVEIAPSEGAVSKSKSLPMREPGRSHPGARIAAALERLAPPLAATPEFEAADAFVWHPLGRRLAPVVRVNRVDMSLLKGIDRVREPAAREYGALRARAAGQ